MVQDPPGPPRLRFAWFLFTLLPGVRRVWQLWLKLLARLGWHRAPDTRSLPERYGNVIAWPVPGFHEVLVVGPDEIRRVLEDNHLNYERHALYRLFVPLLGNSLLTSSGDAWKRRRRMLAPAFLRPHIASLRAGMLEQIAPVIESWAAFDTTSLDVVQETRELALNVAARAMFPDSSKVDFSGFHEALSLLSDEVRRRAQPLPRLPDWVPTPHHRRLRAAIRLMRDTVRGLIASGNVSASEGPSVLGVLKANADLSEEELVDEALTMLVAGHDTTASVLAWTLIELAAHPEIQERIRTSGAGYLGQVLDETMRLHPPAPIFMRKAVGEDVLGGCRIRAGETIALLPGITHRHPAHWPEPEKFDPDRFEPARVKARARYAFFPFGGGPHRCIGEHFALLEAGLVVDAIVKRFRLVRHDPTPVGVREVVSLQPAGPVPVEFVRI